MGWRPALSLEILKPSLEKIPARAPWRLKNSGANFSVAHVPLGTVSVESGKCQPPHFLLHSLRALVSYQWQIWGLKWLGW